MNLEGHISSTDSLRSDHITDLRLSHKKCPPGYEMLSTSLDGNVANLNFGRYLFCPYHHMLCRERQSQAGRTKLIS